MGVIDCLSAGYRFLGRHVELLLIPIALDLLLWFGPQVSAAPVFDGIAALYQQMTTVEGMTPEMDQLAVQFSGMLTELGGASNLVAGLVSSGLLHVPSLPVSVAVAPSGANVTVSSAGVAILVWLFFNVLGLLIGVVYLGLLARRLPIGGLSGAGVGVFIGSVFRQWMRMVGYVVLLVAVFLLILIPLSLLFSLFILVSPVLLSIATFVMGFLSLVAYVYLYLVAPGVVMDDLPLFVAIRQSVRLVRENFWPALGFLLLSAFIGLGFALLLTQLAAFVPWGTLAAIAANAYIGTGLSMALLVFYRSRVLKDIQV